LIAGIILGNPDIATGSYGKIMPRGGPFVLGDPREDASKVFAMQMIGYTDLTVRQIAQRMSEFEAAVRKSNIDYFPIGPNSNSYAFSFLRSLGITNITPNVNAIGWDSTLKTGPLSYSNQPISLTPWLKP
jgi:hypothetical protein